MRLVVDVPGIGDDSEDEMRQGGKQFVSSNNTNRNSNKRDTNKIE